MLKDNGQRVKLGPTIRPTESGANAICSRMDPWDPASVESSPMLDGLSGFASCLCLVDINHEQHSRFSDHPPTRAIGLDLSIPAQAICIHLHQHPLLNGVLGTTSFRRTLTAPAASKHIHVVCFILTPTSPQLASSPASVWLSSSPEPSHPLIRAAQFGFRPQTPLNALHRPFQQLHPTSSLHQTLSSSIRIHIRVRSSISTSRRQSLATLL